MRKFLIFFVAILISAKTFSQHEDFSERIRLHLWAEIDSFPELKENQGPYKGDFSFAMNRLSKIGPYLLNGMVYGWSFSYIPSDKLRGVEEYFEVKEINTINPSDGKISYKKPWIQDNFLHCWLDFVRTPQMIQNLNAWTSINTKKIQGKGLGKLSRGFTGIQDASENALKDAVRSYYREILKNKPKQIDGRVIIRSAPLLGIRAGQYVVDLDFFLETDKIVKYSQF